MSMTCCRKHPLKNPKGTRAIWGIPQTVNLQKDPLVYSLHINICKQTQTTLVFEEKRLQKEGVLEQRDAKNVMIELAI